MKTGQPIAIVDAFTETPFRGNPAAVCLCPGPLPDDRMQRIAGEMNLSETAFVDPNIEGGFFLRWFTPRCEVELCGHATLAAAHLLWEEERVPADEPIRFQTRSGPLTCRRVAGEISMDFPEEPGVEMPAPRKLDRILGTSNFEVVERNRFDWLVLLEDESQVRELAPDFRRLLWLGSGGLMVTAPARRPDADFVSRYFAPALGIDEDPVTGSAHCFLGPFWAERLGKNSLVGFQASRRGGTVRVEVPGTGRVTLGGRAVTMMRGELLR